MKIDVNKQSLGLENFLREQMENFDVYFDEVDGYTSTKTIINHPEYNAYTAYVFENFDLNNGTGDVVRCETVVERYDEDLELVVIDIYVQSRISEDDGEILGVETIELDDSGMWIFDTGYSQVLSTDIFNSQIFFM